MAGKRVRCKQCGNIFALPDASFEDGPDLDALAAVEQSFHSVDATDAGGTGVDEPQEVDEETGEPIAPLRSGRRSVRFNFPLAAEIDAWLPSILLLAGLGWLAYFCLKKPIEGSTGNLLPALRLGTALIAFFCFVGPITLIMIRKAARQLHYQMPTGDKLRTYGAYLPAFALGYVLWVAGGGRMTGLILGCVAGVALATVFLWLFFRLGAAEIAPTATYAIVGFFIGLAVVGAIYFALNAIALQIVISMKEPDLLASSPFGPEPTLAWISADDREKLREEIAKAKPATKPVISTPARGGTTEPPPPPPPPALPTIVKTIQTAPFAGFDEVVHPLIDSNYRAFVKNEGPQFSVQVWNVDTWRQTGTTQFPPGNDAGENRYIISNDGNMVARIATFPGREVQITSLSEQRVTHRLPLTARGGSPELVGFLDAKRLMVRWQANNSSILEVRDISAPAESRVIDKLPPFELGGTTLVFGKGGSVVAIATRAEPMPGQPQVPMLVVYSTESGERVSQVRIEMDSQWPVLPRGMDFTADGSQVALLFEQAGNGLLVWYKVSQPQGSKVNEIVNPSGLLASRVSSFQGSALQWLSDGSTLLLYGQTIFSANAGRRIESIEAPSIERSWIWGTDRVEQVLRGTDGLRQYRVVRLDMARIADLARR